MIIFTGPWHLLGDQRRLVGIEPDWAGGVSPNGWTSCDLALLWLEHVFDPPTQRNPEDARLLVLDGHSSHVSVGFLSGCWSRKFVPVCLPLHSTHLVQPLDVSIFGAVTMAYRSLVSELGMQADKVIRVMFVNLYVEARAPTITPRAARKDIQDCGMTSYPDAIKVLVRLPGYRPNYELRQTPPPVIPGDFTTPSSRIRFQSMLDRLINAGTPRVQAYLRRKLTNTYDGRDNNARIYERLEAVRWASAPAKRNPLPGDRKCLSKEPMALRAELSVRAEDLERVVQKEEAARLQKVAREAAAKDKQAEATAAALAAAKASKDDPETSDGEVDADPGSVASTPAPPKLTKGKERAQMAANDDNYLSEAAIDPLLWPTALDGIDVDAINTQMLIWRGLGGLGLDHLDGAVPGPSLWRSW